MDKYEGIRKAFNEWDCFRTLGSFDSLSTHWQEHYLDLYTLIYDEGKKDGYSEWENKNYIDDGLIEEASVDARENMKGEVEELLKKYLKELSEKHFNFKVNATINDLQIDVLKQIMREVEEL